MMEFMRTLLMFALAAAGLGAEGLDSFAPLLGVWDAKGTFAGGAATARYEWERALAGRFVVLRYRVERGGKTVFEGHGYYRADGAGTWQDSQGNLYPIAWKAAAKGVAAIWGAGGESLYEVGAGGFVVVDRVKGKAFAEFTLQPAARQ
jgi:hypothetical protein